MYIRRIKNENFYILLFLIFTILVAILFWYFNKKCDEKVEYLKNNFNNTKNKIIEDNKINNKSYETIIDSLKEEKAKTKAQLDDIKKENQKLKNRIKALKEKNKILSLGFREYRLHHRILNNPKYKEINILEDYRDFFLLVRVGNKLSYLKILKSVFGSKWHKFSKVDKDKLIDLTRKINRVQENRLKPEMILVVPFSKNALGYSPFKKEISKKKIEFYVEKRNSIVKKYWNDFGSPSSNEIFQNRASKDWTHYVEIDLGEQYFAVYKNWKLDYWGPISSGRTSLKTPTGYYIDLWQKQDWYSEKYESQMWNSVNFDPKGYFTHQENLPGFPASHGCVRMLKRDSRLIYDLSLKEVFLINIHN